MGLIGNTFRNIIGKDIEETKRTADNQPTPQPSPKEDSAKREEPPQGPTPGGPTPGNPSMFETIAKSPAGNKSPVPALDLSKTNLKKNEKVQKKEMEVIKAATFKTPLIEKDEDEYSSRSVNEHSINKIDMNFKEGGVMSTSGYHHHYYHQDQSFV